MTTINGEEVLGIQTDTKKMKKFLILFESENNFRPRFLDNFIACLDVNNDLKIFRGKKDQHIYFPSVDPKFSYHVEMTSKDLLYDISTEYYKSSEIIFWDFIGKIKKLKKTESKKEIKSLLDTAREYLAEIK